MSQRSTQSAIIGAQIAEIAQQKRKRGWHATNAQSWRARGRGRAKGPTNLPGPSWWCALEPSAFYATAKAKAGQREDAAAKLSYRIGTELA